MNANPIAIQRLMRVCAGGLITKADLEFCLAEKNAFTVRNQSNEILFAAASYRECREYLRSHPQVFGNAGVFGSSNTFGPALWQVHVAVNDALSAATSPMLIAA